MLSAPEVSPEPWFCLHCANVFFAAHCVACPRCRYVAGQSFRRPESYRAMVKVTTCSDVFGMVVRDDYIVSAAPDRYRWAEGMGVVELRRRLRREFVRWEKVEPPQTVTIVSA